MNHDAKVLIVDDNPTNLEVLLDLLSSADYTVLVATNGSSALEKANYIHPDIILLDVMMPDMDGFETCLHLKTDEATRAIPVIFMTALTDTADKVRGFEVGAVDYITKPIQHAEVLARVNAHLTVYQQRREIEALREQERSYFEHLNRMKDDILHAVSHDLKNPISIVKNATYLLGQGATLDDDKRQYYLRMIERNADRMLALVTDLLDLAQLETGCALHTEVQPLHPFLSELVENFQLQAQQKKIDLRYIGQADDFKLGFDRHRLDQALSNLISNAIKYTPCGGNITVSAALVDNMALIQVVDSGLGIPAVDLPRIFEKFHRVNTSEHLQQEGSGLGLSIVSAIIKHHQGNIQVESQAGVGSCFSVRLPLN